MTGITYEYLEKYQVFGIGLLGKILNYCFLVFAAVF